MAMGERIERCIDLQVHGVMLASLVYMHMHVLRLGVAISLFAGFLTSQPCMVTCAPSTEEKEQHHTTHATQREGASPSAEAATGEMMMM